MGDHLPEYGEGYKGAGLFDLDDLDGGQRSLQTFLSLDFLSFGWKSRLWLAPCVFALYFKGC